jgi:hypothetical protein
MLQTTYMDSRWNDIYTEEPKNSENSSPSAIFTGLGVNADLDERSASNRLIHGAVGCKMYVMNSSICVSVCFSLDQGRKSRAPGRQGDCKCYVSAHLKMAVFRNEGIILLLFLILCASSSLSLPVY